MYAVTVV